MDKRDLRRVILLLVVALVTVLVVGGCAKTAISPAPAPAPTSAPKATPAPAPKAAFKWPKPLAWASLDVGSGGYVMAAACADTFTRQGGVETNVIPVGNEVGRVVLLQVGRVYLAWMGAGGFFAQEGVEEMGAAEIGPQPIRLVIGSLSSMGFGTAKDANIRTLADLKGKRVSWVKGSPGTMASVTGLLAFANLTWNDVKKVEFPSTNAASRGIIDGASDAHLGNTTAARFYELMASPRGLYFLPFPHKDKEGWKRFNSYSPHIVPRVVTEGAGLSETNPLESAANANPGLWVMAGQDPELVYQQTKLMVELYDQYSKIDAPGIKDLALKYQRFDWVVPYHEGAARYYKEVGVWTDAAQKHNDRLIERQKVLKQAWDTALAESVKKKVSADDYLKLWYQIRGEALKAAGFDPYWKAPGLVPWE